MASASSRMISLNDERVFELLEVGRGLVEKICFVPR